MDVLDLWQSQRGEGFHMTPEDIRKRTEPMEKKLQQRTRGGYLVCASLIVFLSLWAIVSNNLLQRLGAVLTVGALAYMGWQIRGAAMKKPPAGEIGETLSVDFLRAELARQRDFHRGWTFWSRLLLLIPSGLLFFIGFALEHPEVARTIRYETITFLVLGIAAIPLTSGWRINTSGRSTPIVCRRNRHETHFHHRPPRRRADTPGACSRHWRLRAADRSVCSTSRERRGDPEDPRRPHRRAAAERRDRGRRDRAGRSRIVSYGTCKTTSRRPTATRSSRSAR